MMSPKMSRMSQEFHFRLARMSGGCLSLGRVRLRQVDPLACVGCLQRCVGCPYGGFKDTLWMSSRVRKMSLGHLRDSSGFSKGVSLFSPYSAHPLVKM